MHSPAPDARALPHRARHAQGRRRLLPLFPAFGPEPVRERLTLGRARVLVTDTMSYTRKVEPHRADLPDLEHVIITDSDERGCPPGTMPWSRLLMAGAAVYHPKENVVPPTSPEDTALLHFTSGTTGPPKGAVHVHEAVVAHHATGRFALDLRADDMFWCTADPGWVTGTSYGVIAPLTLGVTVLVDAGDFDARPVVRGSGPRVTVWYTAPTALRMLMRARRGSRPEHDLSRAAARRQRRRAAQPRGCGVGRSLRAPGARQLVADRDRRHHGQPTIPAWTSGRARWGGRCRGSSASLARGGRPGTRCRRQRRVRRRAGRGGRAGAAAGWPSMFRGYLNDATATRSASPTAGTSAATSPAATRTATSGSSARRRRHQVRRATSSGRSRSRAP